MLPLENPPLVVSVPGADARWVLKPNTPQGERSTSAWQREGGLTLSPPEPSLFPRVTPPERDMEHWRCVCLKYCWGGFPRENPRVFREVSHGSGSGLGAGMCDRLLVTRGAAALSCYSRQGEKGEQSRQVSLRPISHERSEGQERSGIPVLVLGGWVGLERVPRAVAHTQPSPAPVPELFLLCSAYPVFAVLHSHNYFWVILVLFFIFFFNICLTVVTTQMLQLFSRLTY